MSLPVVIDHAPHVPTDDLRDLVSQLAAFGHTYDEIARMLRLSPHDVRYHYRHEVETGLSICNAKVAGAMLRNATSGDTKAGIFWLRSRAGWRDVQAVQPVGKDGKPLEIDDKRELMDRILAMLTPDQVAQVVREQAGQPPPVAKSSGPPPPASNSRH